MGIIYYLILWSFYVPAFEGGQYQSLERCEAAAEMNIIGLEARYGKLQWRCEAHRGDADAPPVRLRSTPPPLVLAQLIDCHPSYPGRMAERWSWQTIDGHKCYYPGPPRISKKRLHWPESIPFLIIEPDPVPNRPAGDPVTQDKFFLRWMGGPAGDGAGRQ